MEQQVGQQAIPQDEINRMAAAATTRTARPGPDATREPRRTRSLRRGFMRLVHEVVEETIEEVLDPF